jgi:hypothetical protein
MDSCIFANTRCRWIDCGIYAFHSGYSIQDASAKFVDAPLTLILVDGYDFVLSMCAENGGQ